MKPTEGQIKKFWKWYGITWKNEGDCFSAYQDGKMIIYLTGGIVKDGVWHKRTLLDVLPIDLNNLFKWATPILDEWSVDYSKKSKKPFYATATRNMRHVTIADKDPALALFWAIYKLIDPNVVATTQ